MTSFSSLVPFIIFTVVIIAAWYLLHDLKESRKPHPLIGLFFFAIGAFLLIVDLSLILLMHGPEYIPDYLHFERLVSDTGFAGRWMLTIYIFFGIGLGQSIYLLARNMIRKFNGSKRSRTE